MNNRAIKDKERLDFLQGLTTGYGGGWLLRLSMSGRGWRLHETEQGGATRDVRAAIDTRIRELRGLSVPENFTGGTEADRG